MAISIPVLLKETTIDATGQASIGMALTTGASVGDLVVVCGAFGLASTPTVTCADNSGGGNVWTKAVQADKTTNNTPHSFIFSSVLAGALTTSHTITVSFGTNVNYPMAGAYKSSVTEGSWTSAVDQFNSGTGVSTSPSSGDITTTVADELLVGVVCTGIPQTLSYGTGWTRLGTHLSNTTKGYDAGYAIKSATGTYVFDGTITSADWASSVASFGVVAGGGGSALPLLLRSVPRMQQAMPFKLSRGLFTLPAAPTPGPALQSIIRSNIRIR